MQNLTPVDIEKMISLAREAQQHAYAPYSHFFVGCCIKTTNGEFFSGANVENASYSLTICAERSACCAMINTGYIQIADIVIVTSSNQACPPCGACRQFLFEFSQKDTKVHLCTDKGIQQSLYLKDLLPYAFANSDIISNN